MSYVAIKISAWLISGLAAFVLLWDASSAAQKPPAIVGQITTTLNSTPPQTIALTAMPTTTTITTTVPKGCAQYVADAITAGWPADQAPMLARVMFRESRCIPTAYNGQDTNRRLIGLATGQWSTQVWLMQLGYINSLDDLFVPDINLRAALHLYGMVGWSAWAALMADNPYPETGITEETRHMYSDGYSENYNKVFKQFIDDILVPAPPMRPRLTMRIDRLDNHEILLDELELMYEAHMTIGGQQNRFNASVLRAAINVIKAL
jgi:hypothetical protein